MNKKSRDCYIETSLKRQNNKRNVIFGLDPGNIYYGKINFKYSMKFSQ